MFFYFSQKNIQFYRTWNFVAIAIVAIIINCKGTEMNIKHNFDQWSTSLFLGFQTDLSINIPHTEKNSINNHTCLLLGIEPTRTNKIKEVERFLCLDINLKSKIH